MAKKIRTPSEIKDMVNRESLVEAVKRFKKEEGRATFYDLARNLINSGFEVEGLILLLSTWNFAIFRYAVKNFDISKLKKVVAQLKPNFGRLKGENLTEADFSRHANDIKIIYNKLAKIKGVEHTGAPKLMHLINPSLFVMWDGYIRGEKPLKYYNKLPSIRQKTWVYKKYQRNCDGYVEFLLDMQNRFKQIRFSNGDKTLAKAIDEFNYVNVTLPMLQMEKEIKKARVGILQH